MKSRISIKILVFSIISLFIGVSIILPNYAVHSTRLADFQQANIGAQKIGEIISDGNYSHTVFVGVGTSQNCLPCDEWNKNIYDIYSSGKYDFEYVEMIEFDYEGKILNFKAHEWAEKYSIGIYPTSIIDGDYKRIIGNFPKQLPGALNASGERLVANITGNITILWLENGTIQVNISIKNNEASPYEGYVRVFISEIVSRYDTSGGSPYHFGFLDFAFDENISINTSSEFTDSIVWIGKEHIDGHGNDFGDITANNTQVTLVVYNSDGFVEETVVSRIANNPPNIPSEPHPANGESNVSIVTYLSWTCDDPDGDSLTYDVYFGNNSSPEKVSDNQTDTFYILDVLNYQTTYYWKIIAWDEFSTSTEGPLWQFTTTNQAELKVDIVKPAEKIFYLRNLHQFDIPFGTVIYGPINIEVNATSSSGIKKVELYINDVFEKEDITEPYSFRWAPLISSIYTIKVVATDNFDNQEYDEITILKWRAHPVLILTGILVFLKLRPRLLKI